MITSNSHLSMDYQDAIGNGVRRLPYIFICHDNGDVKEMAGGINGSDPQTFGVKEICSISLEQAKRVLNHGESNVSAKVTSRGVRFFYH